MLVLTHASLATVEQLFRYKQQGLPLDPFPGYTPDQWGIKAHNRPWIAETGKFASGQKILEVGGAYSSLPKYLHDLYGCEAWIGDDFGMESGSSSWSRWGNPYTLPQKNPSVKYVFKNFGLYAKEYPSSYFDRIFSVSTLEHIPYEKRLDVFKDMHRCLKPGGKQLHTIDVQTDLNLCLSYIKSETLNQNQSEIQSWIDIIANSGVVINTTVPSSFLLLDRKTLVESPDVVYRFYPPNNSPKTYNPNASLLLIIEDIPNFK
jgi:predicted SAM-dependent methyltransferase